MLWAQKRLLYPKMAKEESHEYELLCGKVFGVMKTSDVTIKRTL